MQSALNKFYQNVPSPDDMHAMCLLLEFVCKIKKLQTFQNCPDCYTDVHAKHHINEIKQCLREHALVLANTHYAHHIIALLSTRNAGYNAILLVKYKIKCMQLNMADGHYIIAISQVLCYLYGIEYNRNSEYNFNTVMCRYYDSENESELARALDFIYIEISDYVRE